MSSIRAWSPGSRPNDVGRGMEQILPNDGRAGSLASRAAMRISAADRGMRRCRSPSWALAAAALRRAPRRGGRARRRPEEDPDDAGQDRPAQGDRAGAHDARSAPTTPGSARCRRASAGSSARQAAGAGRPRPQARRARPRLQASCAPSAAASSGCASASATRGAALAQRLVELYQADTPDLVTVILNANGFADLLERGDFMQRVSEQDQQIITIVRTARADATATEARLQTFEQPPAPGHRDRPARTATRSRASSRTSIDTRVGLDGTRSDKQRALATVARPSASISRARCRR